MKKRTRKFKPTMRSICSLGTLAHNRNFSPRELAQYVSQDHWSDTENDIHRTMEWFKKNKLVKSVARGRYYPTAKGWNMIEKACRRA